jgi:uncharacterized membrane protein
MSLLRYGYVSAFQRNLRADMKEIHWKVKKSTSAIFALQQASLNDRIHCNVSSIRGFFVRTRAAHKIGIGKKIEEALGS